MISFLSPSRINMSLLSSLPSGKWRRGSVSSETSGVRKPVLLLQPMSRSGLILPQWISLLLSGRSTFRTTLALKWRLWPICVFWRLARRDSWMLHVCRSCRRISWSGTWRDGWTITPRHSIQKRLGAYTLTWHGPHVSLFNKTCVTCRPVSKRTVKQKEAARWARARKDMSWSST